MSRSAFELLRGLVGNHSVHRNKSVCIQTDVTLQLIVTLYRFGCYGNSVSLGKVARRFGMSEGAVHRCTDRTIVAILSLEKDFVQWPSADEKEVLKERIRNESGFLNCIGFADGTLAVLENKPRLEGSDYHSRKSQCGISVLIVCDDHRRIRYIFTGFCGSVHDNSVFKESKLG